MITKMGILDFFKRKKEPESTGYSDNNLGLKEDPFGADPFMDTDSGLNLPKDNSSSDPSTTQSPFAQQESNPFKKYQEQSNFQEPSQNMNASQAHSGQEVNNKDLQIIIAKLDALRAEVQNLNHKVEGLERKQQRKMW